MRSAVALVLLAAAIAGCSKSGGNTQTNAGASGLPIPGPRPDASASSSDSNFRQRFREINIGTCVASAEAAQAQGRGAPPGSDIRGYCTCFIDGAIAGLPDNQLAALQPGRREQSVAEQCARDRGMATDFSSSGSSSGSGGK